MEKRYSNRLSSNSSINNEDILKEDNHLYFTEKTTPLLDQQVISIPNIDLEVGEAVQGAPDAPVPYVGKDPRIYIDLDETHEQRTRPVNQNSSLPPGVERP